MGSGARAVGVQPAIPREEPEGATQANTRQATTRVRRSSVHAEETITAEPSTGLEVNGPRWDSHIVETVPETDDAIIARQRVLYQAGRRVFRGRSAEDQTLILSLQNQLANDHERAERLAEELARFHSRARDMHRMQNVHRVDRVQYIANLKQSINSLQQRIRELEAQVDRQEHAMNGLRDDNQTAQLLIAHYKADEDEVAELERRDRQRIEEEIDALTQGIEGLRVRLVDETKKYERMLRDCNA